MFKTRRDFAALILAGGTLAATAAGMVGYTLQPAAADPIADLIDQTAADADLIALGAEFEAAWQAETAAYDAYEAAKRAGLDADGTPEWEAAFNATSALVHRIEELPARTLAGARVKARATFWCYAGDLAEMLDDAAEEATANRLAFAIVADLLGMTAPAA